MSLPDYSEPDRPRVYLAAPLFSDAERCFNEKLTDLLEGLVHVYLPQRDGGLMSEMVESGISAEVSACTIFRRDVNAILDSHFVIAVLDGRTIDEGVAFELGVAYANSKRCIGLQTDCRRLSVWGNNPMITGAIDILFYTTNDLISWLTSEVKTPVASS